MNDEPIIEEEPETLPAPTPKKPRGFAAMDPSKVKAIASKGGKAAHVAGTAHRFTPEEAQSAGRKGGMARGRKGEGGT